MSALVHDDELVVSASLGQLQAGCRHSLCGSLSLPWRECADRAPRRERIRRPPRISALGFGQLSCLRPLGLVTGIPLADPKELLPAQGEPDRTYESSSHTLMANLLWRGHSVTARKLKAPEAQPDVLLADLQHCRYTTPSLALRMAQSPRPISSLPSGLKVSHKQEARSVAVSHSYSSSLLGPHLHPAPP